MQSILESISAQSVLEMAKHTSNWPKILRIAVSYNAQ